MNLNEEYAHIQRPVRLEVAVSDKILGLLDDYSMGVYEDAPRGDIQAVVEGMAAQIIKLVQDNRELWA